MMESDIELISNFFNCDHQRAQDMIDKGINIEFIRSNGKGLYDKKIKEAQERFLNKVSKLKDDIE